MAASLGVHNSASSREKGVDEQTNVKVNHDSEQPASISSQLLYPDKFAESYRTDKLTVIGKGNSTSVKGQLKTIPVPQSSVLSRIKNFLPQLSVANKDMALELANNPDSADKFNIEHIGDNDQVHVEMNLAVIPPELLEADDSTSDESSSESESGSESEKFDQENEDLSLTEVEQTLKLRPTSKKCIKPGIEIIDVQPKNCTEENIINR